MTNVHVYVKMIGSETLLPLTSGAATESKPAWSPDGRSLAFLRTSGDRRGWYLISALGGAERKLADVFPYFDLGDGNSPYYSPDGKYLAIVDKKFASRARQHLPAFRGGLREAATDLAPGGHHGGLLPGVFAGREAVGVRASGQFFGNGPLRPATFREG